MATNECPHCVKKRLWLQPYYQDFLQNAAKAKERLMNGHTPDGNAKLRASFPKTAIAELPDHPQDDGEKLREWAFYMAHQLTLYTHPAYQPHAEHPHAEHPHAVNAVAWELRGGSCEASLNQDQMTRTNGARIDIVQVATKWSKNSDYASFGTGTLIEPNVVVVCGDLLRNKDASAVQVRVTSRKNDIVMGDYVVMPENGLVRPGPYADNIGMIHLNRSFKGVHPVDFIQTPSTDSLLVLGSISWHAAEIPHLYNDKTTISFSSTHNSGRVIHRGDNMTDLGSPILDTNGCLVAVHCGRRRKDKNSTEKVNIAAPINWMGNDLDVFHGILSYMAVNSKTAFKAKAKFLALNAGVVTEVTIDRLGPGAMPAVTFKWH